MTRTAGALIMLTLLAGPAAAVAQELVPSASDRPRVEVGAGGSVIASMGTMPYTRGMLDTRVGVALTRNWSLEGLVHFMPGTGPGFDGFYRAQALWRIGRGSLQPFVTFGGAGEFSRNVWPEYRYTDYYTGKPVVIPAGSRFNIGAPWFPTAGAGIEKVLDEHLAIRADLTAAFGVNDYGIAVTLVPAVSVSVPLGRYGARR